MIKKQYLVCYDITENPKRNKIHKICKKHGCILVQKSVYVVYTTELAMYKLKSNLEKVMDALKGPSDSLLILPLTADVITDSWQTGATFTFEALSGVTILKVI